MADGVRYAKTDKGADEIGQRRHNLRGKLRAMLILVDPAKTADQLRSQAARIGVPPDALEMLVRDRYIAPVGSGTVTPTPAMPGATAASVTPGGSARVAKAKIF